MKRAVAFGMPRFDGSRTSEPMLSASAKTPYSSGPSARVR
jgi:hypothetical protein